MSAASLCVVPDIGQNLPLQSSASAQTLFTDRFPKARRYLPAQSRTWSCNHIVLLFGKCCLIFYIRRSRCNMRLLPQ